MRIDSIYCGKYTTSICHDNQIDVYPSDDDLNEQYCYCPGSSVDFELGYAYMEEYEKGKYSVQLSK